MENKNKKKSFWRDEKSGEFNWALVAVFVLVAIFFYNVYTAKTIIPGETQKQVSEQTTDKSLGDNNILIDKSKRD